MTNDIAKQKIQSLRESIARLEDNLTLARSKNDTKQVHIISKMIERFLKEIDRIKRA